MNSLTTTAPDGRRMLSFEPFASFGEEPQCHFVPVGSIASLMFDPAYPTML
jgi:hypothetical protein